MGPLGGIWIIEIGGIGPGICFAPVLSMEEAPAHPQNAARNTFVTVEGVVQPAPAPRFSRTMPEIQNPPPSPGQHTESALKAWGIDDTDIQALKGAGVI